MKRIIPAMALFPLTTSTGFQSVVQSVSRASDPSDSRKPQIVIPTGLVRSNMLGDTEDHLHGWAATVVEINKISAGMDMKDESALTERQPNGMWIPALGMDPTGYEHNEETVGGKTIVLGETAVASTDTTVVFEAYSSSIPQKRLVVKYSNACKFYDDNPTLSVGQGLREADSLADEYIVKSVLKELKIAPVAYAVSAAVLIGDDTFWLTSEKLATQFVQHYRRCNSKSFVRAILEDSIGFTVGFYFSQSHSDPIRIICEAVSVGLRAVQMVEQMHDKGFLHNNLSEGLLAFRTLGDSRWFELHDEPRIRVPDLVMFDFSKVSFFPSEIGQNTASLDPFDASDLPWLSHWRLAQSRPGRRDDLFAIMEMVVELLTSQAGHSARHMASAGNASINQQILFKTEVQYFTGRIYQDAYGQTLTICHWFFPHDQTACSASMALLEEAMQIVRSLSHPDMRPDYRAVKSKLTLAILKMNSST